MSKINIPPKPEQATWTDDQWKAIMASGRDILVAAAAGSGKTAVLVERIINKIISTEDPINVDELLVVTFTNASAAEMRHRIGEALEQAINDDPKSKHLRKQLSLLNRASISTLHSFCLEVIRKYYYRIDVDPVFRIADQTEAQLLRDEIFEELFEEEYGKADNEAFYDLVDTFSNDRSDLALQKIVGDLYDFARSNPSPDAYLDSIVDMYRVSESTDIEDLPFIDFLMYDVELQLEGAKGLLQSGLDMTKLPGGPAPRADNFLEDIKIVSSFIEAKNESWEALYNAMQSWSGFSRAKACKGDEFNKALVEKAQKIRDKAKKILQGIKGELFSRKKESFIQDIREMYPHIDMLVKLVKGFSHRFEEMKKEKGLVDFADLEHYCLEILLDHQLSAEDKLFPSEAALAYRNQFKEVLVDEYQDTNMVQEAIIQLVTHEGEEEGNLFMVGDVKQSIYRFRLAEPNLFLGKYNRFSISGDISGLRIDLARNFRSRKEVLDGTNYLFKQIMGVKVGEIEYDEAAELVNGAPYPSEDTYPVEVILIGQDGKEDTEEEESKEAEPIQFDLEDLAQSQLEATVIAGKIKNMIQDRKQVYNPKTKTYRPIMYKDIVILMRSMTWAPQIMETFKEQGIPIYANLSTGYFEATEVAIMMSLLKVIDNPYQDIPLASVLRSPIVGMDEEQLAKLRIFNRRGTFYEALSSFCTQRPTAENEELYENVRPFYDQLSSWRTKARQGSLSELIWQLYRDTRFYDFVGGMPGGKQRQANLRALYDRARQYEETSFRGLFRFLRFIERMRDRGDDLGAARALGEQEDVVRIMTIHSSKGLEFPVVFVAGLARQFNTMDVKKAYMLDKELGFAAKYVNPVKRISYPSLPQLAFKRKKKLEMLAEEMRVLYVALTRAKENLFLIGTVKEVEKKIQGWTEHTTNPDWLLNEFDRASAKSYLDWIGPSLVRHKDCGELRENKTISQLVSDDIIEHPSCWKIEVVNANELSLNMDDEREEEEVNLLENVYAGEPVPVHSEMKAIVERQLGWKYTFSDAANHRSKQSVSEIKRQREVADENSGTEYVSRFKKPLLNRPKFMQEKSLTPAEKGTAMHMVMQHVDLSKPVTEKVIQLQLEEMVRKELLTAEQLGIIDVSQVVQFFDSELGKRMIKAPMIKREVPFSLALPAKEAYPDWQGTDEPILIQGIIDCFFEDAKGSVLLDYKTDGINDRFKGGFVEAKSILESRYKVQLDLYTKALEQILRRKIDERILFFFDGSHTITM